MNLTRCHPVERNFNNHEIGSEPSNYDNPVREIHPPGSQFTGTFIVFMDSL